MAPNVAPYVRQKKSKSGKLLEFLGWFTVIIWPVFYYICKLFPWDEADPIDTKQNYIKSSLILMDDEYGEDTSSLPISAANTHHTSLEDYKNHFQQFGKDVHDKVIEGISQSKYFNLIRISEGEIRTGKSILQRIVLYLCRQSFLDFLCQGDFTSRKCCITTAKNRMFNSIEFATKLNCERYSQI